MRKYILGAILLFGFFLRFIAIDKIPAGFTPDEASFGYDAYSILNTGKDQWGHPLPLVFESFGDYKSPLYVYITIPSVLVFGLNKFSVRLPNAIIGTLAIYAVYLLVIEIFHNKEEKSKVLNQKSLAIASSLFLAISPWHIMMSRGAFEANLTTLLLPLSLCFFLKGLNKSKYFIPASIFAGLNLFSYHSAKFVTPILLFMAVVIFRKVVFNKIDKYKIISGTIIIIFSLLFLVSLGSGSSTRIKNVSIFGRALLEASDERIKAINMGMDPVVARLIYNKYQAGIRHFTVSYLSYFSPQFYFTSGPGEGTYGMIPGRGVLFWIEGLFILGFMAYFIKNPKSNSLWLVIIWLFVSPIPAALSIGPGYAANRAEVMLPSIQIMLAIGMVYLISELKKFKYYKAILLSVILLSIINFTYFSLEYYLLSPLKNGESMLWGSLKSAEYVVKNYPNQNVLFSRSLSEPHIYFAFASQYSPKDYQKETINWNFRERGLDWVDQMPDYNLGKFTFSDIQKGKILSGNYDVVVGKPVEFDRDIIPTKILYNPNGSEAVYIVTKNNAEN